MDERTRWNDQAVDGLDTRITENRNELSVLRELPATVARHDERIEDVEEGQKIINERTEKHMSRRVVIIAAVAGAFTSGVFGIIVALIGVFSG